LRRWLAHWTLSGARAITTRGASIAASFHRSAAVERHRETFVVVSVFPSQAASAALAASKS